MAIQYDTDEERKLHLRTIHSIADQYHLDEAMIRDLYESKLEGLMNGARVKTYLSVLAARHVKSTLLESHALPAGRVQLDHPR